MRGEEGRKTHKILFPHILMNLLALATLALVHADRPVDRYSASWATPSTQGGHSIPTGRPTPPDGPYAGNGDVTVMYTGNTSARFAPLDWQQWLYLSKNDMWGSDSQAYYPHLSAGRVGFLLQPSGTGPGANGTVSMHPGNASIVHSLVSGGSSVVGSTRVLENNALLTTLTCTSATGSPCTLTLLLSDTDANHYGVAQATGAAPDGTLLWWRKENLHGALNPAYAGSCDPHLPLQSTERTFTVDPSSGQVSMGNGSCLWADEGVSPGVVTVGACDAPEGGWVWKNASSPQGGGGDIVHTATASCLTTGTGGNLVLGACGSFPWAQIPATAASGPSSPLVYLNSTSGLGCIVAVPDNNNNTLGVALGIADASGKLLAGTVAPAGGSAGAASGTTLTLTLASGAPYTLITALQTLRDLGCAGIRPQWETCTTTPQDAATALVQSMAATAAGSPRSSAIATSDAFWAGYWNASSIDITSGGASNATANLAIVERWYYLSQYLLACTTRDGKVTPALDGFVCIEPVPWGDQFTLDYNLEATFWGAGSSNRLSFIHPVMASSTNPGAVATARLRAQNPGTWGRNVNWHSFVGRTVAGAVCAPDNCPNLTTTGFLGAEWPSAGMPLGDNRLADSDLNTRFVGGLLATNLIQYYEYSRDVGVLRDVIYPFVKDNAEFYRTYALPSPSSDGKLVFPYSCAQEACACRDAAFVKTNTVPLPNFTTACKSPNAPFQDRCPGASGWELNHPCFECFPDIATGSAQGNHNAHPDIAFASSTFRNAVRFAGVLGGGIDGDLVPLWQAALDAMPPYPAADFTFVDGARGSEYNGGAGYFVEAAYGYLPGVTTNGTLDPGATQPPMWPWCNKEYPIANFAAMWPTDEIGATQTQTAGGDPALLARAKQTVYALNSYTGKPWANVNGFCLSWPPAVRVSDRGDGGTLIAAFATAILSTTGNNACVENNGGMLENIGATVAINDLLMQSHGGCMRLFPVWNATELGGASFSTLRAYGAFLVSASIAQDGTVSPVSLSSEVGEDLVFASPWGGATAPPTVTDGKGATIPVTTVSQGVFSFHTTAGSTYTISE